MEKKTINYLVGNQLDLDTVIDLYVDSTLGERRPVGDRACMAEMLEHANLVVTAWDDDLLVGISRTLTDFCYAAYLSDLAVRLSYQRQGIGTELIRQTQAELRPSATLILLAAPSAVKYYPRIGMKHHPSAWYVAAGDPLNG